MHNHRHDKIEGKSGTVESVDEGEMDSQGKIKQREITMDTSLESGDSPIIFSIRIKLALKGQAPISHDSIEWIKQTLEKDGVEYNKNQLKSLIHG